MKNILITQYFVALYSREGILNVSGDHLEQILSLFSPSKINATLIINYTYNNYKQFKISLHAFSCFLLCQTI